MEEGCPSDFTKEASGHLPSHKKALTRHKERVVSAGQTSRVRILVFSSCLLAVARFYWLSRWRRWFE